jgi:hypothetical protein
LYDALGVPALAGETPTAQTETVDRDETLVIDELVRLGG